MTTETFTRPRLVLTIGLAVVAATVAVAGTVAHFVLRDMTRTRVVDYLQANLDSNVVAVRNWFDDRTQLGTLTAQSPRFQAEVERILASGKPTSSLFSAEMAAFDIDEALVVNAQGLVLCGSPLAQVPDGMLATLRRALGGAAGVAPPARLADGRLRMAVMAPIQISQGPAVLVLTIDSAGEFSRILETGRLGQTGETYAIDATGHMVSHSRFITDKPLPAVTTLDGQLTVAATALVAQQDGSDLAGYPCYRGVSVVGAWRWLPDLGVGVVSELGTDEAWAPLAVLRLLFYTILVASALATAAFVISELRRRSSEQRARVAEKAARTYGQYRLIRCIGSGGMGEVHLARHALLRRPTAIKLLRVASDEDVARFEREVRLCSRLSHPNTVTIFDYGRTETGAFYCAMELLNGLDFDDLVVKHGPVPPGRVVHLLRQVLGSLGEAHDCGLVHRDIKPGNLMTCRIGGALDVVKVLDFGLARRVDGSSAKVTRQDLISGTPPFMAPEVIRQETAVDGRADLYAVACVGWFLLTGRMLFDRGNAMEVLVAHLEETPEDIRIKHPWVPEDLAVLLARNLGKQASERSPSAAAFAAALEACASNGSWTTTETRLWWKDHGPQPWPDDDARVPVSNRVRMTDETKDPARGSV
jgi:hypothetical protein